jgi:hypothetical protein
MRPPFFQHGLRFECQQCGICCTGEPGTIYVAPDELATIAREADIPVDRLIDGYLYPYQDGYSIGEDDTGRCFFYDNGCLIYSARPSQCRTFPFWLQNLRNEENWQRTAKACPGIGRGPVHSLETILACIHQSGMV